MTDPAVRQSALDSPSQPPVEVVCFGMVTPAVVIAVEEMPSYNTGVLAKQVQEFISDDAAIVACLLRGWGVRTGLIGTALGRDPSGRKVARQLRELGVVGKVRLLRRITTPFEVNISDAQGARTYFWQRDAAVLDTLKTADLSLLPGAQALYVDWYDGDHILRPMEEARRLGIPVFLNLEHGHLQEGPLSSYVPLATICQAVTDEAQQGGQPQHVAERLLSGGAEIALVTLANEGCLAVSKRDRVRVEAPMAPMVPVVDGCGAGATFSAGFLYGYLSGWSLEEAVRFAVAAASLKCTVLGPQAFPLEEVRSWAGKLRVERDRRAQG